MEPPKGYEVLPLETWLDGSLHTEEYDEVGDSIRFVHHLQVHARKVRRFLGWVRAGRYVTFKFYPDRNPGSASARQEEFGHRLDEWFDWP
jgi:hypothetical protein